MGEKIISTKATVIDPGPDSQDFVLTLEIKRKTVKILIPKDFDDYSTDTPYGLNMVTNGHYL